MVGKAGRCKKAKCLLVLRQTNDFFPTALWRLAEESAYV